MSGLRRPFSHVANFTGYMAVVAERYSERAQRLKIRDLPAGNGLLFSRSLVLVLEKREP